MILKSPFADIPKRLWERLVLFSDIKATQNWADLNNKQIENLANQLTKGIFNANGKSTFKDEFVTAGGVDLTNVDVESMQSKKLPGIYFCGEVMDIDGVTGGFNFQAAWTTGWIAGKLKPA